MCRYFPLIAYAIVVVFLFDSQSEVPSNKPPVTAHVRSHDSAQACQAFRNFPPIAILLSDAVMGGERDPCLARHVGLT